MSKGLEALERIKMLEISCDRESYDLRPITKTHKQDLDTIEKELESKLKYEKAINIVKKKHINIGNFIYEIKEHNYKFNTYEVYWDVWNCGPFGAVKEKRLNKREWNLLCEVFL